MAMARWLVLILAWLLASARLGFAGVLQVQPADPVQKSSPEELYITGSIVDADGELLTEGWTILAFEGDSGMLRIRGRHQRFGLHPDTGEFQVGPVSPGIVRLWGFHDRGRHAEHVEVEVRSGTKTQVVLRYDGPNLDRSIRVSVGAERSPWAGLDVDDPSLALGARGSGLFLIAADGTVVAEARGAQARAGDWWFNGVALAEYALELRHPYFEPVRIDRVIPGEDYEVQIEGTVRLALDVRSSSGEAVKDYVVDARYMIAGSSTSSYALVGPAGLVAVGEPLPGMIPGDLTLDIRSSSGERAQVQVAGLGPCEVREVRVELVPAEPLRIRVVDAQGQGLPGIKVETRMGTADELEPVFEESAFLVQATIVGQSGEQEPGPRVTDSQGLLTIEDAIPGLWTLRAKFSSFSHTTITVDHPRADGGPVVLVSPELGRIEGRILCSPDFDFSTIRLSLTKVPGEDQRTAANWFSENPHIREDGSFLIDGLPLGEVTLLLWQDGVSGLGVRSLAMPKVDVVGGAQTWELDLEPLLSGRCEIEVTMNGKPVQGLQTVLISEKRMQRYARRPRARKLLGATGVTDLEGRASVDNLPAKEAFGVYVVGQGGEWMAYTGMVAGQTYFEPSQHKADIHLVERRVLVLGADGTPLAGIPVGWSCGSMTSENATAVTGADGEIRLRLPVGSYHLHRTDRRRSQLVPFEWSAGAEALVVVLEEEH